MSIHEDLVLDDIDRRILEQLQNDASLSNLALAARVHASPATCLRRVQRLRERGVIERQIAVLSVDRLAQVTGEGLTVIAEVTLERQTAEDLDAFESRVSDSVAVQQCYRVSPGPDFVLVLHLPDMRAYQRLAKELFTHDTRVRNVKAYFSVKRAKFGAHISLAG